MSTEAVDVWFVHEPSWKDRVEVVCVQGTKSAKLVRHPRIAASSFKGQMLVEVWEQKHSSRAVALDAALRSARLRQEIISKQLTKVDNTILQILELT